MTLRSITLSALFAIISVVPTVQGGVLALFEDGTLAAGNGSTAADKNLAGSVTGLQTVPNLTTTLSRTLFSARDSFNGTISETGSNWLAFAMTSVPTLPAAGTAYIEITLASSSGYVLDLDEITFDWQVANNTNATAINFSCAVFVDFHDGNGFVKIGNILTNSALKSGSTAGFGTLQRTNTFTVTEGNTDLFNATVRIAMAASATDSGYAQFFQNIKITGSTRVSDKPHPNDNGSIKLADGGAWTWFNDPRALFHNGTLYVGYVRISDGASCVNACNVESGSYDTVVASTIKQKDDHNNPGLLPLSDGRLMAFLSRHGPDNYIEYHVSTSTTPTTMSDWGTAKNLTNLYQVSYQNPFQLSAENGRIYNFMRSTGWNPCMSISDDLGQTWQTSQHFISASGKRPYVKYASNYKDRIDVLYTDGHPRDVTNSLYHFYLKGGKIYKTDGTSLKTVSDDTVERTVSNLPVLHDSGERGSVIYQYNTASTTDYDDHIPSGRAWCWDMVYDKSGNPVCVFTVRTGPGDRIDGWVNNRIFYYYARYDSATKQWKKRFIAQAGRALYRNEGDYAGGITLDPNNPNVVYISTNAAAPFSLSNVTDVTLNTNERYEIYRGVISNEETLDFAWSPITHDSTKDNLRPYVPRNSPYARSLVYFSGTYTSYTSWSAEVRGIFENKKVAYNDWAAHNGLGSFDASPDADPNHDGIDNLTAYAFDLPPLGALTETELARLPQIVRQNDNTLRFEFSQNALLTDIFYEVETSVDLKTWELTSSEIISQDDNIERHGVAINENEPRRFYRVRITQ